MSRSEEEGGGSSTRTDAEQRGRLKDEARSSRFHFRNLAEHQFRNELKERALEICNPQVKDFAMCAEEKGLMVVFSCRDLYKNLQTCMNVHNGEEAWEKFRQEHEYEIEKRANMGQEPLLSKKP